MIRFAYIDGPGAIGYNCGSMPTLRELRERLFLSQENLASKAKVAKSTVNRLENGLEKPKFVTVRKLAQALEVEPAQIDFSPSRKAPQSLQELESKGWPTKRGRTWWHRPAPL